MNTMRARLLSYGLLLLATMAHAADVSRTEPPIDWPSFIRQHDMTFDKLPNGWTEAPHFGNAMVGSMLYQEGRRHQTPGLPRRRA